MKFVTEKTVNGAAQGIREYMKQRRKKSGGKENVLF